jgi:Transposase DDE domain group 1
MQLSHTRPVASAVFDEPNLVSPAGLVPVMALARKARLRELADERLTVPTDKGANPGLKISSLVAGMVAGADSFEDMALLRHGGMGTVFAAGYAPSTLGSFLRSFTFGHVRQLDAVASRFLVSLAENTELLGSPNSTGTVLVDIDDTIVEVHGYQKQGAAFGYSGVRGLNAVLATVSTETMAPVIAAQRLRTGSAGSPRGAARLATDALALIRRTQLAGRDVLVRADSAFYSHALITAVMKAGANVSITVRMDPAVKRAIVGIDEDKWTTIKYPEAIFDEATGTWISKAQVAEVPFTAFTSKKKADQITGRLIARRIPELNPHRVTVRRRCSRPGGSTPSSPPPTPAPSTRSPRTRPTVGTRSSRTSTPTSRPPRWRTCPPGCSTPTRPGWCAPSWPSTSPAPPPPSRRPRPWRKRPPRPSGASSSPSPPGSPPQPGASTCTCPSTGPGRRRGQPSTTRSSPDPSPR